MHNAVVVQVLQCQHRLRKIHPESQPNITHHNTISAKDILQTNQTSQCHLCKIHPASQPNITHHNAISVEYILQTNQTSHMVTSHHHLCKIHPASQSNITPPSLQNTSCKPTKHRTTISVQDILQANQTKHHKSQHHLCKIHPATTTQQVCKVQSPLAVNITT